MATNIEFFLNQKRKEIELNKEVTTIELYSFVADVRLRYIFAALHQEFNRLIKFMYMKVNYHFNAAESRELIYYIQMYKDIKFVLKDTVNAFDIDEDYSKFLDYCKSFLEPSGGSEIPDPLEKIELKKYEPIFNFVGQVVIKHSINEKRYSMQLIGKGSYAKVYKYQDEFYNQTIVVKQANEDLTAKEIERFKREYDTMKNLNSPYILKVYKYDSKRNEYYSEYADATICDYIQDNKDILTLKEKYNLIMQVLKGFKYIHSKELLHRDISLTNIMLKKYDDITRVKITDFGLVKEKESTLTSLETEVKGSLNDISNLKIVGFVNYAMHHETFALTRLILYILTGVTSLYGVADEDIKSFILKGTNGNIFERFKNVDEMIKEFNDLYKKLSNK